MHATDADEMTPQQRLNEIADILARFLRLKRRPGYVPAFQRLMADVEADRIDCVVVMHALVPARAVKLGWSQAG